MGSMVSSGWRLSVSPLAWASMEATVFFLGWMELLPRPRFLLRASDWNNYKGNQSELQ